MKLLVLLSFLSLPAFSYETVKVGVSLRFNPEVASSVDSLYRGIEFAKDRFNLASPDLKIELVKYSHKNDLKTVEEAADQIIKDQVHFVIGGEMSDEALTLGDKFQNKKIILVTPTGSNPRITENRPLVFRACFSDNQAALKLAQFVNTLKDRQSIGVLHNTGNAYADYLTIEFLKELEKIAQAPMPKITEFNYAGEHPNFSSAVTQFKKNGVTLVVAFTVISEIRAFVPLAEKSKFFPKYLGSDGWGSAENVYKNLVENDSVKGFDGMITSYWQQESTLPSVVQFIADFKTQYHTAPDSTHAIAYDSAMMLFKSIAQAKNHTDAGEVAGALKAAHFTDLTTTRELKFNGSNSPDKSLYLYRVNKDGVKFLKAVE